MDLKTLEKTLLEALGGIAKLQARQEAMECVIRAVITEAPPLHPLIQQALRTAQSDLDQRWTKTRAYTPPEIAAAGLALLNELHSACGRPPTAGG